MDISLPKGWNSSKVEALAQLVRGITYKKEQARNAYEQGYKPILRANNISGSLNFDSLVYVPEELIDSKQYIQKSDIIFAMSSGSKHLVGKSARAIADFDGSYGAFCGLVRPNKKVFAPFLFYSFQDNRFKHFIQQVSKGSNINNLKREHILEYLIFHPSIDEQKSIVAKIEELFSELDSGIASLKTAQEQLKIYRQALLKHAFEGKLTEQWRKDNADKLETPEQLLTRIQTERESRYQQQLNDWKQAVKDWEVKGKEGKKPSKPNKQLVHFDEITDEELEELPSLPGSFIYTHLSNLGDLGRGKSKHRPRNDPRLFGGKYPFIQTGKVKAAGHKITTFNQTYSEFGLAQSKLWPQGTLCITIAANIAETAFLDFEACFPDSVVGFTAYRLVMPQYIELFIKAVRVQIEAYAPATAQKNINLRTLENLVVPYCSLAEQQEVVNQLEEKLTIIEQNEKEIENALTKAELLRQSILKKAFSGQLVS